MKIHPVTDTNNKSPQCPICKLTLSSNTFIDRANSALICSNCNRMYYINLDYDS